MRRWRISRPDVDDDPRAGVPRGESCVEPYCAREWRETGNVGEDGEVDVLDGEVGGREIGGFDGVAAFGAGSRGEGVGVGGLRDGWW